MISPGRDAAAILIALYLLACTVLAMLGIFLIAGAQVGLLLQILGLWSGGLFLAIVLPITVIGGIVVGIRAYFDLNQ